MPIAEDYNSAYTGVEIDSAVGRALPDGAIDQSLANRVRYDAAQSLTADQMTQARGNIRAAKSTVLGSMTQDKIYKIGTYAKGGGVSDVGEVCIRIWDAGDYGSANYLMVFSSASGNLAEFHGLFNPNYLCSISIYADPNITDRTKKYTVFASTQHHVSYTSVSIENEHNFTIDFIDVTDTFPTITSGLEKVWESIYEWENPPLQPGVEYRTTERYLGEPVYYKLVDFGNLPNNTIKEVAHGISNLYRAISVSGDANGDNLIGNMYIAYVNVGTANIRIKTNANRSGVTAKVLIKYTKTTG